MSDAPTTGPRGDETQTLAKFAATTRFDALPPELPSRLISLVIDNLAAGAIGSAQPWHRMVRETMVDLGRSGSQCSTFGSELRFDPSSAALLNGVAIGGFEGSHGSARSQQGAGVFPAVLALSQHLGQDGSTFLCALAVGYEVGARVAAAQTVRAERDRGFHNPAISSVFGAAAGSGYLLGLGPDEMTSALGIAASHAAGLVEFVWDGAMTKRLHVGRSTQMGLESALLASRGFTGPSTAIEGRYGFLNAHSPAPDWDELVADLGSRWAAGNISVKPFPAHGTSVPIIRALDQWHQQRPTDVRVDRISLTVASDAVEQRHLDRAPTSVMGAQYSVPFTTALVALRGARGALRLNEDTLRDAEILHLAEQVVLEHDPELGSKTMESGARITLGFGDQEETLIASGIEKLDAAGLRAAARSNLNRYTEDYYSPSERDSVIEIAENLAAASDISVLADHLGPDL